MLIGVMADTHDNVEQIKKAIAYFRRNKVKALIHAGDYCAPFSLSFIQKLKVPFYGVLGNVDGEKEGLKNKSGGAIKDPPYEFRIGNKKFFVIHDIKKINFGKISKQFDVVIHGHLHEAEIKKMGKALFINPGECCGVVSGLSTVAILDLKTMKARIVKLKLT